MFIGNWQMGGEIMIKNIIIIVLVCLVVYEIPKDDVLAYAQSTLDFIQELIYNVKESEKI